mmetsp:Transcript_39416/g.106620  ORF Transcript_39416/g.106620 Transcript_39416/m.106620 type:complete len:277 (+) Transcript_39416:146-976(+)
MTFGSTRAPLSVCRAICSGLRKGAYGQAIPRSTERRPEADLGRLGLARALPGATVWSSAASTTLRALAAHLASSVPAASPSDAEVPALSLRSTGAMKSMSTEADSGRLLSEVLRALRCFGASPRPLRCALEGLLGGRAGVGGSLLVAALCWISATFDTSSSTHPASFSHISSQRWNCFTPSSTLPPSSVHLASTLLSTCVTFSLTRPTLSSTRPTCSCTRPLTCECTSCSFFVACLSFVTASAVKASTSFLSAFAMSSCLMEFHMSKMSCSMFWTS